MKQIRDLNFNTWPDDNVANLINIVKRGCYLLDYELLTIKTVFTAFENLHGAVKDTRVIFKAEIIVK